MNNARRLQKITDCYRRVQKYRKASLMTYSDGWKYWYVV